MFRGHHAVDLSNRLNADVEGFPLLALDEEFLASLAQHQIDAAIGAIASQFGDLKALQPERFTHQHLEFTPADAVEDVAVTARGRPRHEV